MKKTVGLILALCIVFVCVAGALAAGKPKITQQPQTQTTSKKGSVSFTIKVSGKISSITWHFVDPATGNDYTGKQLPKAVNGVKVSSPNGQKISLSRVPESMHGWIVYCHVNGNGYKLDSEKVQLLVYGMTESQDEPPAEEPPAEEPPVEEPPVEESPAEEPPAEQPAEPPAEQPAADTPPQEAPAPEGGAQPEADQGIVDMGETEFEEIVMEDKTITITSTAKILRRLDAAGNVIEGEELVSKLEFINTGSFIISSEDPIKSWTVNGIRFEPAEPVKELKLMNVTDSLSLDFKFSRSAASAELDESRMCKVSCKGCTFSYVRGGLRSVTEGEVPAGAAINVVANSSENAANGYRINGGEPANVGLAAFRLVVTEDVVISAE